MLNECFVLVQLTPGPISRQFYYIMCAINETYDTEG